MASPVPSPPPTPSDSDLRTMALHLEISRQAHALWEGYGRPVGRDVPIWLEAERQVLGIDPAVRKLANGAAPAAPLADTFYRNPPSADGVDHEPAALPADQNPP